MEIGMFTSGYQRYPLERAFRDAREFGYDYIELWGGRPHGFPYDLKAGAWKEVRTLTEQYEMPVAVYTPEHNGYPYNYMMGSQSQWEDAMAYLETALEMGKALGAEYTLISAGHAGNTATAAEIRERLNRSLLRLCRKAEALDHKLLLEPLTHFETNVCTSANDLAEILDRINSPYLMGMCDIVVPFVEGEPILDYIAKLGNRMQHLHLVDSNGVDETHLVPGEGRIPLPELMAGLAAGGYQGRATIELVTAYINEPSLYARRAVERVREAFEEAQQHQGSGGKNQRN